MKPKDPFERDRGDEFGLLPDFDMNAVTRIEARATRGPSKWLEVHDDANAYGKNFDYRVMDGSVFMPLCPAAQHWIWYVLPEGLPAVTDIDGHVGYVIDDAAGMKAICKAAQRDGLISEDDYVEAMNQNDALMRSGE